MLGEYTHNKIAGDGRLVSVFTKVTEIAEKLRIILLRTRSVWLFLSMERKYIVLGLGITVRT